MKKKYFILITFVLILMGCQSEQTHTYMIVRKNVPYPDVRSFYVLWKEEDMGKKEKVIVDIDAVMEKSEETYETVKDEWKSFNFIDKNDFIEDFFFRRRDKLVCKYLGTLPYRRYLDQHLAEDFVEELADILSLSPEIRKKIDREKEAIYAESETAASDEEVQEQKPAGKRVQQKKTDATYHYEKAAKESGLTSDSDEEVFIKDTTKKVNK